jgi:hypothetical protein
LVNIRCLLVTLGLCSCLGLPLLESEVRNVDKGLVDIRALLITLGLLNLGLSLLKSKVRNVDEGLVNIRCLLVTLGFRSCLGLPLL